MNKSNLKKKGVLLDLDGTIVNSTEAYLEAARTAYPAFGLKVPNQKVALEIPRRLEQQRALDDIIGTDVTSFLEVYLKRFYAVTFEKTNPFPNIEKALMDLSQKAKLALITMRFVPRSTIVTELKHFGIAEYFDCVVTALDTPNPKPSPEALVKAAVFLNVESCNCLVVGDSVTDVRAGKAAGIMTVGVLSGLFSREELVCENPDLILNGAAELPRYIEA